LLLFNRSQNQRKVVELIDNLLPICQPTRTLL
jgi:hypothetical protein